MINYLWVVVCLLLIPLNADAHKLINHQNEHFSFENALDIPDHKISWAIYDELSINQSKYYRFEAKHSDSFYASIVIPKISSLEMYSPTLYLVGKGISDDYQPPFEIPLGYSAISFPYRGEFPSKEFYEPFGQVTYWERQEIKLTIPNDGTYYIVVSNEPGQEGKYSLAVGTIEDFSLLDFFTLLPKSWFDTKIFLGDYFSLILASIIIIIISTSIMYIILQMKKHLAASN